MSKKLKLFATVALIGITFTTINSRLGALRADSLTPVAGKSGITFTKDIAPIVFNKCASCHRPGEVSPFTLLNYQDVKKRAKQIGIVAEHRIMPPWKAEPGFGEFKDSRFLTKDQIQTINDWVGEGAPEGNPADLPPAPKFASGWTLGQPDMVAEPSEEYSLNAEGRDVYRNFVIPTSLTENRWVSAIEVRPGNRKIVHHVLVYLDTSGAARRLDAADPGPGYSTFGGVGFLPSGSLGGWAPGNVQRPLPLGVGMDLPKGADIVLQVHYHKSGKVETDRTKLALYFCKAPVDKRFRWVPVLNPALNIPPGDANYEVRAGMPLMNDATLVNVTPHMHLLGREMSVVASKPNGEQVKLVRIPDWDFNWQNTYTFKEPLKLPRGSNISLVAKYDNSTGNPRNPNNPPKSAHWGEQTTDEMCIAFVGYTIDAEQLTKGISIQGQREFGREGGGRGARLLNLLRRNANSADGNKKP